MFGELKFFGSQKFPFHQREKITLEAVLKKHVEFKYPNNIEDFNMYLDFFQRKWDTECNDNILMGEDNVFHKRIGSCWQIRQFSRHFSNQLTLFRKFNFTCVYVFDTIYPTRSSWQMILWQTKKFFIFFLALYKPHQWLKFCLLTVTDTLTSRFHTETSGWTAYILRYQILARNNS